MKCLISSLLLFSFPALAIKGEYADKTHELANTCRLNFTVKDKGELKQGICSASFLGKKTFATAEHCEEAVMRNNELIYANEKVDPPYFSCPGSDKKYPVTQSFKMSDTRYTESLDLAVMKIDLEPQGIKPIELPKNAQHAQELLKDPSKCFINGYGRDNEDRAGTLRAAQVVEWDTKTVSFLGGSTQGIKLTKNYGQPGDSGGPMYCLENGEAKLVGAISGGKLGENYSIIELIGNSLDWYQYLLNHDNPDIKAFKEMQLLEDRCGYLSECFNKLPSEMGKIVKHLTQNVESLKTQLIKGENLEEKSLNEVWDAIDREMKKNCPE